MSNRNILNQNINGRNILNIKNKNLLDGNAIKISDRNNINVNMKNNTTEQTTINNEDLFLLSDTTGENIKYIKGLNLKQQGLTHIEGGTNINTSINSTNGDTIINLDATILLERVSIKKNPISTTYPINYAFIVSSLNFFKLVAQGSPTAGGESSPPYQIDLLTIIPSTEYPYYNNSYSFKRGLIDGVLKINGKNADGLFVNNTNPQFLIKDTGVNLAVNSILSVSSTGKISSTTPSIILNTLTAGVNLTKTNNEIKLDAIITLLTSINGYGFNTATNSTVNQFLLKDTTVGSFSSGDFLTINSSNKVDNISRIDLNNSILGQIFITNGIQRTLNTTNGFTTISISTSPSINLSDTMTLLNTSSGVAPPNNGGHAILKIEAGGSASFKPQIHLFQSTTLRTLLEYDKANNKFLINAPTGSIDLSAYNGTGQILVGSQNVEIKTGVNLIFKVQSNEIISLNNTAVSYNRKIGMNSNPINFGSATDANHQILYSGSSAGMDGVLIRGFGNGGVPFFRLQSSDGSVNILDAYTNKINMFKPLEMNLNQINFQTGTANHYIKFSAVEMDGVEVVGYGAGAKAIFRVACSNGSPQTKVLEAKQDEILFYKSLVFPSLGGGTDFSSIKYTNDKKTIISIEETGELRFDKSGTTQNYFKTIKQGTGANGRTFFFEQGGDSGSSNGGAFQAQCSRGKVLFQSDRNLVIYNPDGSVAFSANDSKNAHSSRDYKTNINDLVEDESVNVIKQINPVSYEYKKEYYDDLDKCTNCNCNVRKGFIWEDIKSILPQSAKSVNMNNPDYPMTKLLDLREIIPDLVKTVQYLMNKVEKLESQINNNI